MKRSPLPQSKILPNRYASMKSHRPKSTPARRAAKGQSCLLNVANVCNYDNATVVLVHFRWLGGCGVGMKPSDAAGAFGCSACNSWTDSPTPAQARVRDQYESERNFYAARALVRMRKLEQGNAE